MQLFIRYLIYESISGSDANTTISVKMYSMIHRGKHRCTRARNFKQQTSQWIDDDLLQYIYKFVMEYKHRLEY